MQGVARAINQCLLMGHSEKVQRHAVRTDSSQLLLNLADLNTLQKLYETVKNETAAVWAATNILKLLESLQGEQATQNTPPLNQKQLVEKYTKAKKRLLLFDYGSYFFPLLLVQKLNHLPSSIRRNVNSDRQSPISRRPLKVSPRFSLNTDCRSSQCGLYYFRSRW